MNEVFRCEDKETLVAYLYGEVDADVRREVERHLRTCTACARESLKSANRQTQALTTQVFMMFSRSTRYSLRAEALRSTLQSLPLQLNASVGRPP